MTLTLYMSRRFENTIMGYRIGTFLGLSVHLPCLVVYLCDNRIEIFAVNCHHFIFFINKTRKYSWLESFLRFLGNCEGDAQLMSDCIFVYAKTYNINVFSVIWTASSCITFHYNRVLNMNMCTDRFVMLRSVVTKRHSDGLGLLRLPF